MQNIKVIIGAAFGGEGKGKVVNTHAKNWADVVVRFNGGCQATHTVMHADTFSHVFGHLCSAACDGIPSYLSKYFVVYPRAFLKELDILSFRNNGIRISDVYVDKSCIVTTPYDVVLNQALEMSRGDARHSSAGVGFHETVVRNYKGSLFSLNVNDINLFSIPRLEKQLRYIRDEYTIPTLSKLGITVPEQLRYILNSDYVLKEAVDEMTMFVNNIRIVDDVTFLNRFNNIVFEGSHGLLLDEQYAWFPYVTHSRTGTTNVQQLISELDEKNGIITPGLKLMQVIYVTRPYMIRCGCGPFPSENTLLEGFTIFDGTNKPHAFKGISRVGYLDVGLIRRAIRNDIVSSIYKKSCMNTVHITCIDHIDDVLKYPYMVSYDSISTMPAEFISSLFSDIVSNVEYSYSPFS